MDTFSCAGSPNRPLQHFQIQDVSNAVTLLLSNDESTLFVGARDAVLSLDVSQPGVFTMKTKVGSSYRHTAHHEHTKHNTMTGPGYSLYSVFYI